MTDQELFQEFLEFKKFKESQQVQEPVKPKRRVPRRRAKGSGSIYCLKGNRSKPWVASVTIGINKDSSKQVQKPIGYFKSQAEAQTALSAYELQSKGLIEENSLIKMSDIEKPKSKCPTFKEIWDILFEEDISKLSYSSKLNNKVAFNHLKDIHHLPIDEVKMHNLKQIFDKTMEKGAGHSKLNLMKVVCAKVFNYAIKYDYIDKDYSKHIEFTATNKKLRNRKQFTNEEVNDLFKLNTLEAKIILTFIFTGLRPQELLNIEKNNVHLDKGYMIGGLKTANGINRVIPLHELIKPFVEEFMNNDHEYLIYNYKGRKAYQEYRSLIFHPTMKKINTAHDPYDTRHTFATLCNECNLNEYLIKKMMGHSSNDLTKDVYTHATIKRLVEEVNKIKIC